MLVVWAAFAGCASSDGPAELRIPEEDLSEAATLKHDGKWYPAMLAYRKLVNKYPDFQEGWYNLGVCYDELSDTERAIEAYNAAIACSEGDYDVYARMHLALNLLKMQSTQRAVSLLIECREKNPRYYLVHYNLAAAYRHIRDLDNALGSINTCIEYVEDDYIYDTNKLATIYELKAHILLDLGKGPEAQRVADGMAKRHLPVSGELENRLPPKPATPGK